MIWQEGPRGSLSYVPTGTETEGIPDYKAVQEFSPEQQKLYDTSTAAAQKFGDIGMKQLSAVEERFSEPFSMSQFGERPAAPDISSLGPAPEINPQVRAQQQQAILDRFAPQMQRDRELLETQLVNQGFQRGSEAFDQQMDEANRQRSDFYLATDIAAGDEMARMYGLEQSGRQQSLAELGQQYGYDISDRDRAIQEAIAERSQPLSELSTLITGGQPRQMQFVSTPQGTIAPPDFMSAAYGSANIQNQAAQNAFNQQMANRQSNMQGLYGLAGTGARLYGASQGWNWGGG